MVFDCKTKSKYHILYMYNFVSVSPVCSNQTQAKGFHSPMAPSQGTSGKVFRSNVGDLSYLLSDNETEYVRRYIEAYEERFPGHRAADNPNLCFFLGDNPLHMKTWSATSCKVPTFRRNAASGKYWFPFYRRWMTNSEKPLSLFIQYLFCICESLDMLGNPRSLVF